MNIFKKKVAKRKQMIYNEHAGLDGELAVPCDLQSATARLKGLPRGVLVKNVR